MRAAAILLGVILSTVLLSAEDRTVDFDRHTDFSAVKTFALREGKVDSPEPELNSTLLLKKIGDAIRTELTSKGLKETLNNPDVVVDYSVAEHLFNAERGGPTTSSEGTLVIDLTKRDSHALVWRGVYRDTEKNSAKLAQKLPADVKKSLAEYPPKQKGSISPGPSTLTAATPATPARRLSPKAAAAAALDIVESTRAASDFVGPNAHPGLSISLTRLERAARAISEDDGSRPAATATKTMGFYEALGETADYATSISDRQVETADSRVRARALASKLRSLSAVSGTDPNL